MITTICRLFLFLLCSLFYIAGCSAELPQAPTSQLIKGPFTITTEWQTIEFAKPLKTSPHIQYLDFILDKNLYEPVDIQEDEFHIVSYGYRKIGENRPIELEVILVNENKKKFRSVLGGSGTVVTKSGEYNNLSYGTNVDKGKFFYPKDTNFLYVKVRSNTEIKVEHLSWTALFYYQSTNNTWDDIHSSEIVVLK